MNPKPESVTSRTFAILNAFDETHTRLRLSDLATRADLPISTTHRLAAELVTLGALQRLPDRRYAIGRRLWQIGLLSPIQVGLREAASPFLNDVHAATKATVHIAIRDRLECLYVDRLGGTDSTPIGSTVGSRRPLHATGVGKVLLAHAPSDIQHAALLKLDRVERHTITNPRVMERQLERIREEGFATTQDEMTRGSGSVAVPVQNSSGSVIAALGVVVVDSSKGRQPLLAALRVAAAGIGRAVG